jgi:hypothetical protein
MLCCAVTGQSAGVAAVFLKDNTLCRKVNISTVQTALKKQGGRIE